MDSAQHFRHFFHLPLSTTVVPRPRVMLPLGNSSSTRTSKNSRFVPAHDTLDKCSGFIVLLKTERFYRAAIAAILLFLFTDPCFCLAGSCGPYCFLFRAHSLLPFPSLSLLLQKILSLVLWEFLSLVFCSVPIIAADLCRWAGKSRVIPWCGLLRHSGRVTCCCGGGEPQGPRRSLHRAVRLCRAG